MRWLVVQTGRLRDPRIVALRDEYVQRFQRFGRLEVIEREPAGPGTLWPPAARWRIALEERGELLATAALAQRLAQWSAAHGPLAFLLGDAEGHHPPSLAAADARLSLSPLTLPHRLAHLVLVEQLYRCASLLAGLPYHRG
ncbi:MAG: 23S rRNA (pseudouridine(1915)-N(3))-methyltransferase RlmH [Planctomycetota bacterium]|nr:23S rRNA (pseudouridine(1915)-N(3))-methyltransferase RlmH [Planctomycetota bacterium]MDW8372309.1 23S rRNA (pseudouridine(1915)-N(3))-methyltransferase RlmH [Planctomycetota bacterium]